MNKTDNWYQKARSIITGPQNFFMGHKPTGYSEPLKFSAISLLISGIIGGIGAAVFAPLGRGPLLAAVSALVASLIGGIIAIFIGAGIVHIFVYLLGGREGYQKTFSVAAYATALSPISAILGLIPIVGGLIGFLISLYALYIYIKGVEIYQEMSAGRAAVAVLLPFFILTLIAMVLAVLFFSLAFLSTVTTGP